MAQYLNNKIQTPDGTILQSFSRHDYKTYVDENGEEYMVDGGLDYLRRNVNKEPYIELSLELPQPHRVIREELTWGSYGKSGNEPLRRILIKNMETDHIKAVLEIPNVSPLLREAFTSELLYRMYPPEQE